MASKKKESEGIALLSMYNDEESEDDDDEMEEQQQNLDKITSDSIEESTSVTSMILESQQQKNSVLMEEDESIQEDDNKILDPVQSNDLVTSVVRSFGIVDYGHDETAMSPEAEEGEIGEDGGSEKETIVVTESVSISVEVQKNVDPLDNFLPPPPKTMCSEELQEKINKFLKFKKLGRSFNDEVRNRKDYRNPDFLLHAVRYQDIDQIGSCFSKDVFDPHGYDKRDFYDELEADIKQEMERKEQERKKSQRIDYVPGGTQVLGITAAQRNPAIPTVPPSGFHSHPLPPTDSIPRSDRPNKKSKWDKVDGDRRNQDGLSAAAAHAALLSATSVGAGYTAFAQQKRREAEEKRSGDRRRS